MVRESRQIAWRGETTWRWFLFALVLRAGLPLAADDRSSPEEVDYNLHVRPILADRCYPCHGPDEAARVSELRLDRADSALAALNDDGDRAIVPGDVQQSVLWQRIHGADPEQRMPPADSRLRLSDRERAVLTTWIERGAAWEQHWAWVPPRKSTVPGGNPAHQQIAPARQALDRFVRAQLPPGLMPAPQEGRVQLLRRVSFDLTGLPATPQQIDAFLADRSPGAYERVVDRLLNSVAHAERLAMDWLDVARYGDTQGMHGDRERYHWPWRDWLIGALQSNMPYDDFITWQLAGDLLPGATREQQLATAFHRNHPVSAEGGIIDEEFRMKYVQDRVNTTATAFLGLTLECASCHDHKFDPFSQREYYQLVAYFNNLKELGMVAEGGGSSGPVLLLPGASVADRLQQLEEMLAEERARRARGRAQVLSKPDWLARLRASSEPLPGPVTTFPLDELHVEPVAVRGTVHRVLRNTPIDKVVDRNSVSVASGNPKVVPGRLGQALRLDEEIDLVFLREGGQFEMNEPYSAGAWIKTEKTGRNQTILGISGDLTNSAWRGWDFYLDEENRLALRLIGFWPHNYLQVTTKESLPVGQWHHVLFSYNGSGSAAGVRLFVNGRRAPARSDYDNLYRTIVLPWQKQPGWPQRPVMVGRSGRFYTGDNGAFCGSLDHIQLFPFGLTHREVAALYADQSGVAAGLPDLPDAELAEDYLDREHLGALASMRSVREQLGEKLRLMDSVKEIMVLADMPAPRPTFVLERGQYDAPTEPVQPGVPSLFSTVHQEPAPNRLGLAHWLVDPSHPLTARVTVNRYWQMLFGRGIVATPQDFGTQGARPSHPELLDWLAVDFVESGWNLRRLLRMIVTSATYRQASSVLASVREQDPENVYLARGPSHRLPAEMIRDNALAASGLLSRRVGGPSVKPYQPPGLWVEKTGPGSAYRRGTGEALYRRSMYTYVRRTSPHPAMTIFDAPNRSVCTVQRERTTTPLQALVLLNDPQYLEAARVLAQRVQQDTGDAEQQVRRAFRRVCGRWPAPHEGSVLLRQLRTAQGRFARDPEAAETFLKVGDYRAEAEQDPARSAALTLVVSTILNFDEAYMKR